MRVPLKSFSGYNTADYKRKQVGALEDFGRCFTMHSWGRKVNPDEQQRVAQQIARHSDFIGEEKLHLEVASTLSVASYPDCRQIINLRIMNAKPADT